MEGGKRKGRGKKNEGEGKEGRWEKKGSLLCAAGNTCTERVQGDGASAADSSVISSSPPTRCAFDATRHVSRERERGVLESRALAATTTTTTRLESNRGPITPTYSSLVGRLASCRDRAIRAFVPFSRFFFLPFLFLLSPATRIARLIGLFAGKRRPIYRRERTVRENVIVAKVIKVGRAGQQLDTLF